MNFAKRALTILISMVLIQMVFIPASSSDPGPGRSISGSVFVDLDRDSDPYVFGSTSVLDSGETGSSALPLPADVIGGAVDTQFSDFSVQITDVLGGQIVTAVNADGSYEVSTAGLEGDDFVVELLVPGDYSATLNRVPGSDPTTSGNETRPLVWHVNDLQTDLTDQHIGVLPPSHCPATGTGADGNPNSVAGKLWTTCFVNGDRSGGGATDAFIGLNYDVSVPGIQTGTEPFEHIGTKDELGAVWGVAYDEWNGVLYTSAFLKRYSELGDADGDGDNDLGGVYWMDYSEGTVPSMAIKGEDLENLTGAGSYGEGTGIGQLDIDGGRDSDTVAFNEPSRDIDVFSEVANTGIGDIDVTPNGQNLLVMNLETKMVDVYDTSAIISDSTHVGAGANLAFSNSVSVPDPGCGVLGQYSHQPFAIKAIDNVAAYVGVVCADNSQGAVYAINISTGAVLSTINIPGSYLSSTRGYVVDHCIYAAGTSCESFNPWLSDYNDFPLFAHPYADMVYVAHPTPIIADIGIEADGSLNISVMDRTAHQWGSTNYAPGAVDGPLEYPTHLAPNNSVDISDPNQGYTTSSGGDLLHVCADGSIEGSATCPRAGSEWFSAEDFGEAFGGDWHQELTAGGLFNAIRFSEVVTAQTDAEDASDTVGQGFPENLDSGGLSWFSTEDGGLENNAANLYERDGASGLTSKANGIGDVEGCRLPVEIGDRIWLDLDGDGIQDPGEQPLAGMTVVVEGSGLPGGSVTVITDANGYWYVDTSDGLLHNEQYTITISATATNLPVGITNGDLIPTISDAGSNDELDSDMIGNVITTEAGATFVPGEVNHSYDAGFTVEHDLALTKVISDISVPANGSILDATVTFDITVTNQGPGPVEQIDITDVVDTTYWETFYDADNADNNDAGLYGGAWAPTSAAASVNSFVYYWDNNDGDTNLTAYIRPDLSSEPPVNNDGTGVQSPNSSLYLYGGETVTIQLVLRVADSIDLSIVDELVNIAEISEFDIDAHEVNGDSNTPNQDGNVIVDVDSTPDADLSGDTQPVDSSDPTDNEIGQDGKNGGDEDDHDPAFLPLYDLSLIKTRSAGQSFVADTSVSPSIVNFDITVKNQALTTAYLVGVSDYLPAGMVYSASSLPTQTDLGNAVTVADTGAGSAGIHTFEISELVGGDSLTFGIALEITDIAQSPFINGAEIDSFDNNNDANDTLPAFVVDIDSTPDNVDDDDLSLNPTDPDDPRNSHNVIDYDPDSDSNFNEPTPGDEDDHDREVIVAGFDLALQKQVDMANTMLPLAAEGKVAFNLVVTNQKAPVQAFNLADYVQPGLIYDPADNAAGSVTDSGNGDSFDYTWTGAFGEAIPTVAVTSADAGNLGLGESVTIPIVLTIDGQSWNGRDVINWAEISNFDNDTNSDNGDAASGALTDLDSTPNADIGDDAQPEGPDAPGDDEIDGNSDGTDPVTGDEDDHDVAGIPVLDLALRKVIDAPNSELPVEHGSEITFNLEIINQGSVHADGVTIYDYVDLAMWEPFDIALNPAAADYTWAAVGTDGQVSLTNLLAPASNIVIPITLTVAADADLSGLLNKAEISAGTASDDAGQEVTYPDGSPILDIDSVPNSDVSDDNQPTLPGDPTDNVVDNTGGDEDDHDIAGVESPTFSLGNQVWFDENNNGIIDDDEPRLEGIWVELFTDNDSDGQPDDRNGDGLINTDDAVGEASTDSDGLYLFSDLAPGNYIVGIPPMEWDVDGPLYGMLSSDPTSDNPDDDLDNDDNGFPCNCNDGYVYSGTVTLIGGEPTGENPDNDTLTKDSNENLTVDFGFWKPVFDMALRKQLADGTNSASVKPGDTVTFNLELFNQGNVSGFEPTIVDYVPAGLLLADPDWTLNSDGTASYTLTGVTIAVGESVVVPIDFVVANDAPEAIDNLAEITNVFPVNVLGEIVFMPNGQVLPDIDSVADADNSDNLIDDAIDGTDNDEDDHDVAMLTVDTLGLAFSGANTTTLALLALLATSGGWFLISRSNRRKKLLN